MSLNGSIGERFKRLIEAVMANQTIYGIDTGSIVRLNELFTRYPEIVDDNICEAMLILKDGPQLNAIEIAKLGPLFNIALMKDYVLLNEKMPEKDTYRQYLECFAKAMGIVLQVKDTRAYKSRFLAVLNATLVFKDTFSDSFVKGKASITLPTTKDEPQIRLSADLNLAITSNLLANQEILKSTPIQRYQYDPQQKRVIFSRGILSTVITSLVAFQNAINNHNYIHYIVQKPFLKFDSGIAATE